MANTHNASVAHLSRAVSTAYYCLYQHLLDDCCLQVFGNQSGLNRARQHLKRSITHNEIKTKCKGVSEKLDFPPSLVKFANAIVDLQNERHKADYDENRSFNLLEVLAIIAKADHAIKSYNRTEKRHRLAFAVWIIREKKNWG
ncbi:MAG: hypothetical protein IME92_02220 [Proteobacteria bacterium]|nr:hypothetical protein [Pseudomonadota bacterium]